MLLQYYSSLSYICRVMCLKVFPPWFDDVTWCGDIPYMQNPHSILCETRHLYKNAKRSFRVWTQDFIHFEKCIRIIMIVLFSVSHCLRVNGENCSWIWSNYSWNSMQHWSTSRVIKWLNMCVVLPHPLFAQEHGNCESCVSVCLYVFLSSFKSLFDSVARLILLLNLVLTS